MNLGTSYLGIRLPHPLMVGSGPLTDDLDTVRRLEDEGAAALVLRALYEEEITGEQMAAFFASESHGESFAEATSYSPEPESALGPEEYLEHLRRVKAAVKIPVVASLNGTTHGGWISYARLMEQAGADALELDLFHAASDPSTSGAEVERQMLATVREVKREIRIPVAVKLAPDLPIDGTFPFVHPERSFMHLGFHIYDLGFQSQNSEAAKPMVFTTTLLLIGLVAILNFAAIWIRSRLRRKFVAAHF